MRKRSQTMRRKTIRLIPLFLFLAAGFAAATAQLAASSWSDWQPAMTPRGLAHPSIQYRWRSDGHCTEAGCQLAVEIRNTGKAPAQLHCAVYFDGPPSPYEDEVRPVTIDAFLKPFGGARSGSPQAGDTTHPLAITGLKITAVVVERPAVETEAR
jgi:hypothetical protein